MSYWLLRFEASFSHAETWSDVLLAHGALSVELSDPNLDTDLETPQYGEPGAPKMALWAVSRVTALFPIGADAKTLDALMVTLASKYDLPLPVIEYAPVAERDWVRETQAQFGPIKITDTFWIVPTWSQPPEEAHHVLRLDPGLAFGTGSHPTTRLCLRWLCDHSLVRKSVLDYGCGSGVLLLAACLLGAGDAYGTDIDPQALLASRENAALNQLAARFVEPNALPEGRFDLVIANILANPLLVLAPLLAARVNPNGNIILSGILSAQQDEMIECYREWFDIRVWQEDDGWVLLAGAPKK
ncbi:MAG: 50S ribosomal protein L11 methyltransferase [Burkholderiales bacterium]|jgi:ribosomal protein L11 methyltransferase|nr:50S ribosomal protein L11 methyltransferase [Burkholderiales bacterium]